MTQAAAVVFGWPGLVLTAALVMGSVLVVGGGTFAPLSIGAVIVAYGLVAWVVLRVAPRLARLPEPVAGSVPAPWDEGHGSWTHGHVPGIAWLIPLGAGVATALALAMGSLGPVSAARVALASSALVAATSFVVPLPRRTTWLLVTVLAAIAMALAIATHTPSDNDVWYTVQGGADAILRGDDPYTQCWPGNPDPKTDCVYAYLPATSVVLTPFRIILGDVRFGYIAALGIASLAIFLIASARTGIALGGLLMVVGALLADRAWTEPLILAAIAVMVWAARWGRLVPVIGLAGVLAFKQHMVLLLPLGMAWPVIGPWRAIGAAVVGAITTLPWLLGNPGAFLDDTLWFHLGLVPRADSLSLYALLTVADISLPPLVGAAVVAIGTLAAIVIAILRLPRDAIGFTLGAAFVMFTFNLLNKQSFYNHHALVVGLLLLVVALETGRSRRPGS